MTEDANVAELRDKLRREVDAIEIVAGTLLTLDPPSRGRVLRYVSAHMSSLCVMCDPPPVTGQLGSGCQATQDDCRDSTPTPREVGGCGDRPGDVPDKYISDVAERARLGLRLRQLWWTKPNKQFDVGPL